MRRIQSRKKKLGTYQIDKVSLSVFTDNRFVSDDGIHTLAYFQSMLFPRAFFDVICLVELSTLFLLTFSNVILMDKI